MDWRNDVECHSYKTYSSLAFVEEMPCTSGTFFNQFCYHSCKRKEMLTLKRIMLVHMHNARPHAQKDVCQFPSSGLSLTEHRLWWGNAWLVQFVRLYRTNRRKRRGIIAGWYWSSIQSYAWDSTGPYYHQRRINSVLIWSLGTVRDMAHKEVYC